MRLRARLDPARMIEGSCVYRKGPTDDVNDLGERRDALPACECVCVEESPILSLC